MKKKPNDAQEDGQLQECLHNGEVASDGWAIIPYGDWPHEMGMQKFHRPQAEAIVAAFENAAGRFFRRAVVGLPILKGHPDHPVAAIANQYPDKGDKGQIAEMEARDDGLALRLILSSAGADLVRKGWKFISPLWLGQLVSQAGASFKTYAPTKIVSVGLVSKPNIPVPSLANSAPAAATKTSTKPMNPEILKALGLPAEATEEQVLAAVTTLANNAPALANEQTARTTADGKATALENEKKVVETKLASTETALANERSARAEEAIGFAIRTGRITEAEKPVWMKRLLANSDEFTVLGNAAVKVKVAPVAKPEDLAKANAALENAAKKGKVGSEDEAGEPDGDECGLSNEEIDAMSNDQRGKQIKKIVADHMGKLANSGHPDIYNRAYANAKKANPRLFGFTKADAGA